MTTQTIAPRVYTKAQIGDLLMKSDPAVCRAILAIQARQTADEKSAQVTKHTNAVGWSQAHASFGGFVASLINRGLPLRPDTMTKARKIALRYTRQLAEIANEKAKSQVQAQV